MKKHFITFVALTLTALLSHAQVTIEQCVASACDNYPLIKKYGLLSATEALELSDINKTWLPRIGAYAQGTLQNVVPSFPAALSEVMERMGGDIRGLGKEQYKIGVDINQTIWDGGVSKSKRSEARSRNAVDRASLDVEMYQLRQRVENIYFAILLMQSHIDQTESALKVYESNLLRLRSMQSNGVAMQSDVDMLEAQYLSMKQQLVSSRSALKSYRDMLALFTGLKLAEEQLTMPSASIPADMSSNRPEMTLFDSQHTLNDSRRTGIDAATLPKVGFFAQSYYGYPGIDYFKAMMSRELTFNIVAGVKISWNIDAFYTRKNALRRIAVSDQMIDNNRDTFLFNNSLQTISQLEDIRGLEAVMTDDARIVNLRRNVRIAAESQLRNGTIDATALIMKINDETQAALTASYHTIQHIQAIYKLKNTLNR